MDKPGDFNEEVVLSHLKHYLPAQAPLKDFIHHNTLHAFQHDKFHDALHEASEIFGYKTYLRLDEYRNLYQNKRIEKDVLEKIISERYGKEHLQEWLDVLINKAFDTNIHARVGRVRNEWKNIYHFNISKYTHPTLFRTIGAFIDQGIASHKFPVTDKPFLEAIRELEKNSFIGLFNGKRARKLLHDTSLDLTDFLKLVVGDEDLYEHYLMDQQFEHPGWSGMVSAIEDNPGSLLDRRKITLKEFIIFELLIEIDALDHKFGEHWAPIGIRIKEKPQHPLSKIVTTELSQTLALWQDAYEWSYYDQILNGLQSTSRHQAESANHRSFQGIFCIDDRECSLRRHLEDLDKNCETYATAGFFNVEFYFRPEGGKFYTKLCPAPVNPKHIILEKQKRSKRKKEIHFSSHTNRLVAGWLITQTIGFWSALKLLANIFRPSFGSSMTYSFHHMDKDGLLTIENKSIHDTIDGLQIGFTIEEMADRIEGLLKGIGLTTDFAPIVYIVGHGASSANNPYYAGYDCGACSGRPGSVNARVAAHMANDKRVRNILSSRGINIPAQVQFIGALQDTTRDEIQYFDEHILSVENKVKHEANKKVFLAALTNNAKERARRFVLMDSGKEAIKLHKEIKLRSVSLFEPRPEYNHATNALCIVGRREVSQHIFLDRRSFLNSYDYRIDKDGKYLLNILKAIAPVCGGINLEYYFSRVDNARLGAGSKLPHNVMGLVGVANGADGDLRTGLPQQMVEIHDPVRLLVIVEHFPETVLHTLQQYGTTYEWFFNEWIHIVVMHPESKELYKFREGQFINYTPTKHQVKYAKNMEDIIKSESENIEPIILE